MIQKIEFNNIAQVPLIYKCIACYNIPKNALQDSECGKLTCASCRQVERISICDCQIKRCKIIQIDYITHETLQQIEINCHICLKKINYYQYNKHVRNCQNSQNIKIETSNLQMIYSKFQEKLLCKICKLQCNTVCKYCQIQCCNTQCYKSTICCVQKKQNQLMNISEDEIRKIQDDSFECNQCQERINYLINHSKCCHQLIIKCEFCQQNYQRQGYRLHLKQCLEERLISLKYEKQIKNQTIYLQYIKSQQAILDYIGCGYNDWQYDKIAKEDETD